MKGRLDKGGFFYCGNSDIANEQGYTTKIALVNFLYAWTNMGQKHYLQEDVQK